MQRPKNRTKFSITPMMDFTSKIREIVEHTHCKRHGRLLGQPCWWIPSDGSLLYAGICSSRISQRYNGVVTEKSLSNKRPASNRPNAPRSNA